MVMGYPGMTPLYFNAMLDSQKLGCDLARALAKPCPNLEAINKLIDQGAHLGLCPAASDWRTGKNFVPPPIVSAIQQGLRDLAAKMLDKARATSRAQEILRPDINGCEPLMWAVRYGALDIAGGLIALGADVNVQSGKNGFTPLMQAVAQDDVKMMAVLMSASNIDLGLKDADGRNLAAIAKQSNARNAIVQLGVLKRRPPKPPQSEA